MKEMSIARIPQKITKRKLKNKSMLIGEEIDYLHSFIFGIYVKTGSDNEPVSSNGISHLVEHLLFKGTEKRSAEKMALDIEKLGGLMNAYTARDHTCFYVKCMPKNFKKIFVIFQEMIYQPLIDFNEIKKEKNVILEEIKSAYDDPEDLVFQNLNQLIFKNTRFEKSILGTEKSVSKISCEKVLDYIEKYYTNNNMFYAYAGPVGFEECAGVFEDKSRRPGASPVESSGRVPDRRGEYIYEYKDFLQQYHVLLGRKSNSFISHDRYALMMLVSILGSGMSSRLFRVLREKNGLVYSVYAFTESFKESGTTGIYFACNEKNIKKTMSIIKEQLDSVIRNGVTDDEIKKVKNQLMTNLSMNYDSLSGRMSLLARSILYDDKLIKFDDIIKSFEKVKQKDIIEAAKRYFEFEGMNISVVGSNKRFKI